MVATNSQPTANWLVYSLYSFRTDSIEEIVLNNLLYSSARIRCRECVYRAVAVFVSHHVAVYFLQALLWS
jgi:hypothetical protein